MAPAILKQAQLSVRQLLIQEMQEVLRSHGDQPMGTGLARQARWGAAVGCETTGNAADAALAAGQRATTVCWVAMAQIAVLTQQLLCTGTHSSSQDLHSIQNSKCIGLSRRMGWCGARSHYTQTW